MSNSAAKLRSVVYDEIYGQNQKLTLTALIAITDRSTGMAPLDTCLA